MVSNVETISDVDDSIRALDQGQVMAWTRYPPAPKTYWPLIGFGEGLISMIGGFGKHHYTFLAVGCAIAGAAIIGVVTTSHLKLRGQTPLRNMPPEIRTAVTKYLAAFLLSYASLIALSLITEWMWLANPALGAFSGLIGGPIYERHYRAAADQAERRVGLQ
jgi:hypothetical protein